MSSELPDGWILKPLGEVSEIKIGGTPSRSDPTFWSSEGHYWASIADLLQNPITRTKERISDAGVLASNVKPIKAGTVLMSFKLTIGRVALAGVDLFTNEAIAAFAPDEEQLDPGFLYHALPGTASRAETDTAVKGKTLNKTKLRNLSIALPPLHEQRKIAEILSSVDEVIRANEAVIEQTERVKQATLRKLLTKGIEQSHRIHRYASGAKIPYRGRMTNLNVRPGTDTLVQVQFRNGFHIEVPVDIDPSQLDALTESALRLWLKKQVRHDVQALARRYGDRLQVKPKAVRVKEQKHMWGSCGKDRVINLNWQLVFAPKHVLDYAVLHEMAHLVIRDHSPAFWNLIGSHMPQFATAKGWLERNEHMLGYKHVPLL